MPNQLVLSRALPLDLGRSSPQEEGKEEKSLQNIDRAKEVLLFICIISSKCPLLF